MGLKKIFYNIYKILSITQLDFFFSEAGAKKNLCNTAFFFPHFSNKYNKSCHFFFSLVKKKGQLPIYNRMYLFLRGSKKG